MYKSLPGFTANKVALQINTPSSRAEGDLRFPKPRFPRLSDFRLLLTFSSIFIFKFFAGPPGVQTLHSQHQRPQRRAHSPLQCTSWRRPRAQREDPKPPRATFGSSLKDAAVFPEQARAPRAGQDAKVSPLKARPADLVVVWMFGLSLGTRAKQP